MTHIFPVWDMLHLFLKNHWDDGAEAAHGCDNLKENNNNIIIFLYPCCFFYIITGFSCGAPQVSLALPLALTATALMLMPVLIIMLMCLLITMLMSLYLPVKLVLTLHARVCLFLLPPTPSIALNLLLHFLCINQSLNVFAFGGSSSYFI